MRVKNLLQRQKQRKTEKAWLLNLFLYLCTMIANKSRIIAFLLLATIFTIGCEGDRMAEQLEQIDSLLIHDKVDSALILLKDIPMEAIHNKKDSAYYYLLMTEAQYREWISMESDSAINYSIGYYEDFSDNEKLARSYYYKGVAFLSSNNTPQTIFLLKQAEEQANKTNNNLVKHKIYEKLAYYNGESHENELAIIYAKKALSIASILEDEEKQAVALQYMSSDYLHLGKKDSATICLNKCLSHINSMPDEGRPYLYTNIGRIYENEDPQLAKIYLKKALDLKGLPYAYKTLSMIYLREDSVEKANELWAKALSKTKNVANSIVRVDILKAMRQQSMERKDLLQANALADSILKMQERFYEGQKKEQIAEIQAKYDKDTAVRDLREKYMVWGLGLLALTTVIIAFLGFKSRQGMKARKELTESKIQLDAYTRKASELESSGKASATEINKLHEKINELTHRHSGILAKGKELYEAIETGGTTVHWKKDDFINYLEYYKMRDLPFVNEMETEYNRLSPKYIFFAVLEHEGKSEEDIQRIMGISESTLRSTRSRINSKKQ